MKTIQSTLEKFKERLDTIKTYQPTTLFDIEPSWEKLKLGRCPICGTKLTIPKTNKIALCKGKRHQDKKSFVIKLETLNKILSTGK